MIQNKTPAFTIIELIVTMIISSIVIGIIYTAYLLFNRQFGAFQRKSEAQQEYLLLKKAIAEDINQAIYVKDTGQTGVIMYSANAPVEREPVLYIFDDSLLVRKYGLVTDTLCKTLTAWRFQYVDDTLSLINKLVVKLKVAKQPAGLIFTKQYDAQQLMRANNR